MGKNEIKLSPKYWVNPTIPVCFWCGKEKNEIALLGHIGDKRKGEDIEAPRTMLINYEPCDECRQNMDKGFTCIEVVDSTEDDSFPEICKGYVPTGRWSVITLDSAKRLIGANINLDPPIKLIPKAVYGHFFNQTEVDQ